MKCFIWLHFLVLCTTRLWVPFTLRQQILQATHEQTEQSMTDPLWRSYARDASIPFSSLHTRSSHVVVSYALLKITTVFSSLLFCSLLFINLIFPPLFFIIPSSLFSAGFLPLAAFQVHPHIHIHSHWSFPEWNSVTPRWVFGSVQTAMGWEKNSPYGVWPRRQTILVAACAKEHLPIHEIGKSASGGLSLGWWCVGALSRQCVNERALPCLCDYDTECFYVCFELDKTKKMCKCLCKAKIKWRGVVFGTCGEIWLRFTAGQTLFWQCTVLEQNRVRVNKVHFMSKTADKRNTLEVG